ncbi:Replication-relaxation [Paenibacillus sp. cl141a]|uniref:replication-relaxation family protein n=1 Tax=Paenibacillus sp. cl141a TaxID=1761877 RepID=UPI0008D8816B|nr:replication-relaxation family protein [Paenibacillus sp. cl141a]SEK77369.1 Replication-relaxation [Paenibacillus sp. cl141a]
MLLGRKEIGSSSLKRKTPHVQHTVMRNEVFLWLQPEQWREEFTLKWDDNTIITDALFKLDGKYGFLEIDITQSMAQNEKKINMYKRLRVSGRWQAKNGPFPEVLYVTISEYRKEKLSKMLGDLQGRVVTVNDIK